MASASRNRSLQHLAMVSTDREGSGRGPDIWLLLRGLRGRLAFCRCSWRTSATFGGLTLAGKLPLVPCPWGRLTTFPSPRTRRGRAEPGELPGGPAPSAARGSHPPGQGSCPQSLKSWHGGHLWGGVHILAPSWRGGGEGKRPTCQPPGDPQTRCVGDGALNVLPMTWLETRVSPRPVAPAVPAPADAGHAMCSCRTCPGKARALGVYTRDTETYSRRKTGARRTPTVGTATSRGRDPGQTLGEAAGQV